MSSFSPWKIVNLELSEGINVLPFFPNCQGLYVVFWWQGIPLGHQEILAVQLPMPAEQLANLAIQTITPAVGNYLLEDGFKAPLPDLPDYPRNTPPDFHALMSLDKPLSKLSECYSLPATEGVSPSVSVVICTRNRPEQLAQCLQALQQLSPPPLEVLVIDNAPTSQATYNVVAQMPGIRYVPEPRPGLSVARNTGIRHSKGDIVAFTDDDVIVHSQWIARLQQSFHDPRVMCVTGQVLTAELEKESQVIFEKRNSFNQGYRCLTFDTHFFQQKKHLGVPVWRIGAGANMALRRKIFELVGYFDQRLGAGTSGCSEDSEFWYRVLASGFVCRYEPTAVVYHCHRQNMDSLKQQMYSYMRGHTAALLIQFENYRHWGNLYRLFIIIPKWYTKHILRGLIKGFAPEYKTVFVEFLGVLAGIKFYLQNKSTFKTQRNKNNETTNPVTAKFIK